MSFVESRLSIKCLAAKRKAFLIVNDMELSDIKKWCHRRHIYSTSKFKKELIDSLGREIYILDASSLLMWSRSRLEKLARDVGLGKDYIYSLDCHNSECGKILAQAIAVEIVNKAVDYSINPQKKSITIHSEIVPVNSVIEDHNLHNLKMFTRIERRDKVRKFIRIHRGECERLLKGNRSNLYIELNHRNLCHTPEVHNLQTLKGVDKKKAETSLANQLARDLAKESLSSQ
jgi:hypothetical protein